MWKGKKQMTTKEALERLKQPFNYPPDTDSYFDAKEVAMKSLEKDLSIIKELENLKEEIDNHLCIACVIEDLGKEKYKKLSSVIAAVIDEHISEIKGDLE